MARRIRTPAYNLNALDAVLAQFRTNDHFMNGGRGVSCFVWINGQCLGSECLRLDNGVEAALRAVPGVTHVRINSD